MIQNLSGFSIHNKAHCQPQKPGFKGAIVINKENIPQDKEHLLTTICKGTYKNGEAKRFTESKDKFGLFFDKEQKHFEKQVADLRLMHNSKFH